MYDRVYVIMYNTTKTGASTQNSKVQYIQTTLLNNKPIQFVDSFTNKGQVLSSDFKDNLDITKQLHKTTAAGFPSAPEMKLESCSGGSKSIYLTQCRADTEHLL